MATHGKWLVRIKPPGFKIRHAFERDEQKSLCGNADRSVGEWQPSDMKTTCHECVSALTGYTGGRRYTWQEQLDRAIKAGTFTGRVYSDWPLDEVRDLTAKAIHVLSESKREGAYQFLGAVCEAIEERDAERAGL